MLIELEYYKKQDMLEDKNARREEERKLREEFDYSNLNKNGRRRFRLWFAQKTRCWYCDVPVKHPNFGTLDHIMPKSKSDTRMGALENLLFCCRVCNRMKGNISSYKEGMMWANSLARIFTRLKIMGLIE